MAFNLTFAAALMHLSKIAGFDGHLVTISKYNCWFSYEDALGAAQRMGFTPRFAPAPGSKFQRDNGTIIGSVFFRMLGFSKVTEIEYADSGHRDCVLMDLNQPDTPESLVDSADAVFDLGTSEHIFHFPNLLRHMGRMLKLQGLVLHHAPTNGQVNHGFFQFSPTAYFDYYRANGYTPLVGFINQFNTAADAVQDFHDIGAEAEWKEITLDHRAAMTVFLARKNDAVPTQVFPLQSVYARQEAWPH